MTQQDPRYGHDPSAGDAYYDGSAEPPGGNSAALPAEYPAAFGRDIEPEKALDAEIEHLERWARAITRTGRNELWISVLLRVPAIGMAAGAVAAGLSGRVPLMIPLLAGAALLGVVVAALPRITALALHRRALCDIRDLEAELAVDWHKVRIAYPDRTSRQRVAHALELLELVGARRKEVGSYLGGTEPSSGVRR
jgi:hypothetical protein